MTSGNMSGVVTYSNSSLGYVFIGYIPLVFCYNLTVFQ